MSQTVSARGDSVNFCGDHFEGGTLDIMEIVYGQCSFIQILYYKNVPFQCNACKEYMKKECTLFQPQVKWKKVGSPKPSTLRRG